jgi:beta-mannosidase
MAWSVDTLLSELLASDKGRAVLEKHIPCISTYPNLAMMIGYGVTLRGMVGRLRGSITQETLAAIDADLKKPVGELFPEWLERQSLDDIDNESYNAGPSPLDSEPQVVELAAGTVEHASGPVIVSLDGEWQMAAEGEEAERLAGEWVDAVRAVVPGSVHTALVEAGKLPEPTFGVNQKTAKQESFRTWWMKRAFPRPEGSQGEKLVFGGICNRCTIWLNGQELGRHEGMFGGPEYEIADLLRDENTLVVRLDPIPFEPRPSDSWATNPEDNISWRRTVVFNNVYGWHYSNLPSLGIWRSVKVEGAPTVVMQHPFVATANAEEGVVDLVVRLEGLEAGWSGKILGSIEPDSFEGGGYHFEQAVGASGAASAAHLQFTIPDPHLWWPVDLGEQNLYTIKLSFVPDGGGQPDYKETTFGIRTVEMAPLPDGPRPDKFNWTFIINGEAHFIKGTGWCTMDPLMDFSRERYDRLLTLAALQHVQMVRGWGSGMPETDEFYDLCDRRGVMVLQEWPTAWDSHEDQPYDVLEETVRLNTLRLRNHPSLVMWGAGNESPNPFGEAIDMMGRLAIELDGTRAFHRGEPWGGSIHNYNCYWGRRHLDHNLNMTAGFFGEFGLACMPMYESVLRYLPDDEKDRMPPSDDGAFAYHTPIFNTRQGISRLAQYARYFVPQDCTMEQFTIGSQLSQAVGVRHPLELARTRWPECSGALYYKMNDNFPAASWACVDWYGAPKIGHYVFQDAFAPLHACVILQTLNFAGTPVELPIYLLDDADELAGASWQVVVRAYGPDLQEIKRTEFSGAGTIESPLRLGEFSLSFKETDATPLLIVAEVIEDGEVADRTFYWTNYECEKGCLFTLPQTTLQMAVEGNKVTVGNTGDLPAVAVNVAQPGHLDTFTVSDSYFWLDAGEEWTMEVNDADGLTVGAWNVL